MVKKKQENIRKVYVSADATAEDLEHGAGSMFLAGPTPRCKQVKSWRPQFIKLLQKQETKCTVFLPELKNGGWLGDHDKQTEWEYRHLHLASAVVFWVPRDLDKLPGFITNVEFGFWVRSDRCFYGRPPGTPVTRYLDWLYKKEHSHESPAESMEELIDRVIKWMIE